MRSFGNRTALQLIENERLEVVAALCRWAIEEVTDHTVELRNSKQATTPWSQRGLLMQVLCKASNTASDVRCNVCGQGFLVYWTRTSPKEREAKRVEIQKSLREHHEFSDAPNAHPRVGFHLPEWQGDAKFSAAALLGGAPNWVLR